LAKKSYFSVIISFIPFHFPEEGQGGGINYTPILINNDLTGQFYGTLITHFGYYFSGLDGVSIHAELLAGTGKKSQSQRKANTFQR
jgi:hypothetical protein